MSLGLNKTKRRIASIQSTQKITKAMEMVATVKLKRFRDALDRGEEYVSGLRETMGELFLHDEEAKTHYSLENEEVVGSLYIVITSSLGLCAGYNGNIFKFVEERADRERDVIAPLGEKGKAHYSRDPSFKRVDLSFPNIDKGMDAKQITEFCRNIKEVFNKRKYRKVILIYTHYVNSISFVPAEETLLPVRINPAPRKDEAFCPPIFEPSAREQIHILMPFYLGAVLHYRFAESQLSEQASRRNAMDNANDNADELLRRLTIEYNKARQSAITQEIVEVVSGSVNATK